MLSRQQAEDLLQEVLTNRSELDDAECKSNAGEALERALCAASNRRDRNGGVVLVGVNSEFEIIGVTGIEKVQLDIVSVASSSFNVPLRITPELLERDGVSVLAIIVPPCPAGHRPCHFKKHGPYEGSWIRVGNSTRKMGQDEVRREIAADEIARGTVPPFDVIPYLQAGLEAFDNAFIDAYILQVKKIRPSSRIEHSSREKMLRDINATAEHDGQWYPTPTGLLFFCAEPQRYLPQSSVEFLHLWGPELTTLGPDGSRWRVNLEFFGTLPQIIDGLEALLLERVASRGFIDTFRRRDEPEYPRFALREAVINAVAHRDYSMRGSHIQIRLYPNRLEIYTPGGLPPPVTVDNIEDEKSTRNENIVSLLQDFSYMERRGYGFDGIVATMRDAGLAPPQVKDDGASFGLCLKSHVLMEPEAITWLRQFDAFGLSPQERLALAYLRVNDRLYNRDYVRLSGCTSVEATQALRQMVNKGVVAMKNTRGGAYYTLPTTLPSVPPNLLDAALTDEEVVVNFTRKHGSIRRRDVIEALGITPKNASALLLRLKRQAKLVIRGTGKAATYSLPASI